MNGERRPRCPACNDGHKMPAQMHRIKDDTKSHGFRVVCSVCGGGPAIPERTADAPMGNVTETMAREIHSHLTKGKPWPPKDADSYRVASQRALAAVLDLLVFDG